MKVAAVVCFVVAGAVVVLTVLAAQAFGQEYGYAATLRDVLIWGAVIAAIPFFLGIAFLRKARRKHSD